MQSADASVKKKLKLLELAEKMKNVSDACDAMGFSRDSYYRFLKLYEMGGPAALANLSRRKPLPKNRVSEDVEQAAVAMAFAHPSWGQARAAAELQARGTAVSSSGVRSIWQRYDLETKPKRVAAIAIRADREGLPLSAEQQEAVNSLRRKARNANGSEPHAPGDICYQDLVYVGDHPVSGPLNQHVVVDAYSRFAFARLETGAGGTSPADFLKTVAAPWFAARGLSIGRVRAHRRTPFGGKNAGGYRGALEKAGIKLTYRMASAGMAQDPADAFQKAIDTGFYQPLIRAGLTDSLETLNRRLEAWLRHYNEERVETAACCYGNSPASVVAAYIRSQRAGPPTAHAAGVN